ncbi:MAG: diguanylate cyclase domain-containing protein [Mycobacterium sp.]
MALRDPLTGLPNRGLFRSHFQHELARAKRCGSTLALLLIDLDNFRVCPVIPS